MTILKLALNSPIILDFSSKTLFSDFSCIPGCINCCGYSYFLPKEVTNLPIAMKENLILKEDGKYDILLRNKRCAFYNSRGEFFCTIYDHRPLRCKIYPFFPLIVEQRIIITLEPSLKMKNHPTQIKRCPGIGIQGKPLKNTIKECISFLEKLSDVPALLMTMILDSETFNRIRNDRWFIEHPNAEKIQEI